MGLKASSQPGLDQTPCVKLNCFFFLLLPGADKSSQAAGGDGLPVPGNRTP